MDQELVFRILFGVILFSAASISIYYRARARMRGGDVPVKDENRALYLFLRLGGFLIWASMFLTVIYPPFVRWETFSLPIWVRWAGAGLAAASVPLIFWMFRSLDLNITPTVATRAEHTLVTHGPYRWIRHPLYTFGLMVWLGLGLLAANWLFLIGSVLAFAGLAIRTNKEEAMLIERFGDDYRSYMKRTGRFLPRLAQRQY